MILFAQPGFFVNDSNATGILLDEHRDKSLLTIVCDCRHRHDTNFTGANKCVAIETRATGRRGVVEMDEFE